MKTRYAARATCIVVVACAALAWAADRAAADVQAVDLRLRAAGRLAAWKLDCHARAARRGIAASGACLARLDPWFAATYGAADTHCDSTGGAAAMMTAVDGLVATAQAALQPRLEPSTCAAIKLRVVARRATQEFICRARAAAQAQPVDPACLASVAARYASAFVRSEQLADCLTVGDAASMGASLDLFSTNTAQSVGMLSACPTAVSAVIDGGTVNLSWDNPGASQGFTHALVLRQLNAPPTGPSDTAAAVVFRGMANAAGDALVELLPDLPDNAREYFYTVYGCDADMTCEPHGTQTSVRPTLVQALRGGGYVLHWRHASADVCSDRTNLGTAATTQVPDWWRSCDADCGSATARQLNVTGVNEATAIGNEFRRRGIPVGRVLSSEFCRNVTTAELMNFGPTVELEPGITYFVYDEPNRCSNSYALLREVPAAGTNTALIGHAGFSCPVLDGLAWSEAAIFKPDGNGETLFVTRVLVGQWSMLP